MEASYNRMVWSRKSFEIQRSSIHISSWSTSFWNWYTFFYQRLCRCRRSSFASWYRSGEYIFLFKSISSIRIRLWTRKRITRCWASICWSARRHDSFLCEKCWADCIYFEREKYHCFCKKRRHPNRSPFLQYAGWNSAGDWRVDNRSYTNERGKWMRWSLRKRDMKQAPMELIWQYIKKSMPNANFCLKNVKISTFAHRNMKTVLDITR